MAAPRGNSSLSSRVSALMRAAIVWENHCCMPFEDANRWMPQLQRYVEAGFDSVHINIGDSDVPLERAIHALAGYRAWIHQNSQQFVLASSAADIIDAHHSGKLAVFFDIEGAHVIGRDPALIPLFYELGVRWMLMAYNCANAVGGGCHDTVDEGLTEFGRRVIAEMDRTGMIKDVAHTGYKTAMQVIECSEVPVNISHSNPQALNDHPRCVPDDLMKACAATGGVLGISGLGIFLGGNDSSTANMVRSIEYAVEIMGIDHVGLGLDYVFDQGELSGDFAVKTHIWPSAYYQADTQFVAPEKIPDIVEALLGKGFRDEDVAKILGDNFMRVARQV